MGNASQRLLAPNPRLETRWHSGRRTPVTLRLEFPAPVRAIEFCPSLRSEAGEEEVALVVVDADDPNGRRTAFLGHWQDARWCAVALPWDARRVRVEFVTQPSAWIALRAVRAGVSDDEPTDK
jgi:hypothetical protein